MQIFFTKSIHLTLFTFIHLDTFIQSALQMRNATFEYVVTGKSFNAQSSLAREGE